jgi:hypothetical protein
MTSRIVSGLLAAFFLAQAGGWIFDPGGAAQALGMPLLEGAARSSQVGDIGAFFLSLGLMIAMGAYRVDGQWLRGGALLLGSAAGIRTLAWLVHGAEFTPDFIGVEVVAAATLCFIASRFDAPTAEVSA